LNPKSTIVIDQLANPLPAKAGKPSAQKDLRSPP
jgi:hypothetical protein